MYRALLPLFLVACPAPAPEPPADEAAAPVEAVTPAGADAGDGELGWTAPDEASIPEGPAGDAIRRGMELFDKTDALLPEYAPGNITCSSCHLDKGRKPDAAPLVGATARFPKYMGRTGAVIGLPDRINYCFTRSMSSVRLSHESQEMTDLVAYIAWLSQGIPVGSHTEGEGLAAAAEILEGDAERGEALYTSKGCVACHQPHGGGVRGAFPALWGPDSYSIGASMAREARAASFIQRFMPQTAPGSLSWQEAFDLSAFINGQPRPDSPAKENDWPEGGAPYDVPYATFGHDAYRPPPLLDRPLPELSVVPKPPRAESFR